MKMIRNQINKNWPKVVTAEIKTCVSAKNPNGPMVYRFYGDVDAKALAPRGEYKTLNRAIIEAKKIGWEEAN